MAESSVVKLSIATEHSGLEAYSAARQALADAGFHFIGGEWDREEPRPVGAPGESWTPNESNQAFARKYLAHVKEKRG